jgi:hypothetical protein
MDHTVDELSAILEDCLTWRQMRSLAKRHKLRQYSFLGKRQLAQLLAITATNKIRRERYAIPNTKRK